MRTAAATALLAGSLAITGAGAAQAETPVQTGCAAGWPLTSVASLTALGYRAPARVDAAGNNAGYICAHRQPIKQCGETCPVPVFYNFRDNDLPLGQTKS